MNLQCHKCESTNTKVVDAEKLSEETGDKSFTTATAGMAGVGILALLPGFFQMIAKIFGFMEAKEKNKRQVVICIDCGYWEKI